MYVKSYDILMYIAVVGKVTARISLINRYGYKNLRKSAIYQQKQFKVLTTSLTLFLSTNDISA